ncbi:MAG: GNAT family N-acetyltransferase [Desulfamplus sp.]|nr:GNAT family N-acetyltransferase [Desulfamplus sp.]
MIRQTVADDFRAIYDIINDAAIAYKGIIPDDRWHEPYMSEEELSEQIQDGVRFFCYTDENDIIGVMGIQDKKEVNLIRHAYVRTKLRNQGVGSELLKHLILESDKPILIGTWKDATWAIRFYQKYGFSQVSEKEKDFLLKKYWKIPVRQIETSVVLADNSIRKSLIL